MAKKTWVGMDADGKCWLFYGRPKWDYAYNCFIGNGYKEDEYYEEGPIEADPLLFPGLTPCSYAKIKKAKLGSIHYAYIVPKEEANAQEKEQICACGEVVKARYSTVVGDFITALFCPHCGGQVG